MAEPTKLPLGVAREAYAQARRRGIPQSRALQLAAEVDRCPSDDACCAKCGRELQASETGRLYQHELWCLDCVMHPPKTLTPPVKPP